LTYILKTVQPEHSFPSVPVRFLELDSLRGIAALTVVLYHFRLVWVDELPAGLSRMTDRVVNHLLTPFCAGPQAVTLFFILSGFVLSLPALNSRAQTYKIFVVRRIFRIYFPYLFAIMLGILGAAFFHGTVTRSDWFKSFWSGPVQWRLVAYHVLFVGVYNTTEFDTSIWSLVHEMRVSLIFPFLCAFVLRFRSDQC
jgi:peptidoglycan/LPS O-acetylase OafA/YrhL